MENKRQIGTTAEKLAVNYLIQNNYSIINTNFRCKIGEIDIIAKDNDYIVFIEVKYRKNTKRGLPREAVNYNKQKTIIKVANYYILQNKLYTNNFRFDVVEIIDKQINLIKNAFSV